VTVLRISEIALAGCLLVLAGSTIILGIITAEALYPDVYSTHENTISDLGVPFDASQRPSALVFNGALIAAGLAITMAAYGLQRAFNTLLVTIPLAANGVGTIGVGVFPSDHVTTHFFFAVVTFVSGGLAAILAARIQHGPFRYVSVLFGLIALTNLVLIRFGESTPVFVALGIGGTERWISYPVDLWLVAFGAYLASHAGAAMPSRSTAAGA
jgi:hypothetical membrane protein